MPKIASAVNGQAPAHGRRCRDQRLLHRQPDGCAGRSLRPAARPSFDGHDFLAAAAQQGAAAASASTWSPKLPLPQIVVADTLQALGDLAAAWRRQFAAAGGGDHRLLRQDHHQRDAGGDPGRTAPGLKTAGNFNNLIGLPLTLFQLTADHRWAVLEMGMSERGEIARLAEIAAPTVGMITNVAPAHLVTMKSLDGVARAKGELFAALQPGAMRRCQCRR